MEGPVSATPPPHLTGYSNRRGCAYHKFLDKLSVCWQQPACCGDSHHEPACGNSDDEPEQQYMHDILVDGPAADMWSCGVLLYQLVSFHHMTVCLLTS